MNAAAAAAITWRRRNYASAFIYQALMYGGRSWTDDVVSADAADSCRGGRRRSSLTRRLPAVTQDFLVSHKKIWSNSGLAEGSENRNHGAVVCRRVLWGCSGPSRNRIRTIKKLRGFKATNFETPVSERVHSSGACLVTGAWPRLEAECCL